MHIKTTPLLDSRAFFVFALATAALIAFAIHALDFRGSVHNFQSVSNGGVLLDIKPSFSEEEIYQRLTAYGEEGRDNYAFRNLTVDVMLPLAMLPALLLLMRHALRAYSLRRALQMILYSFAVGYVIFDLAENGAVLALLAYYPDRMHLLATILPYMTVIKRAASLLALGLPIVLFGVTLLRVIRSR